MPIAVLRCAKEFSGYATRLSGNEDGNLPRIGEEFLVRLNVVGREVSALPRVAVVPTEQQPRRLRQLLLHSIPQP